MSTMTPPRDFRAVGEVTTDDRARITFGKARLRARSRFRMLVNDSNGEILLVPMASIPASELFVWENPELLNSILTGLSEASNGDTVRMDHLFDDDDDDDHED